MISRLKEPVIKGVNGVRIESKRLVLLLFVIFSLLLSPALAVVEGDLEGQEDDLGEYEEEIILEATQIDDWYDLDGIRDDLDGEYVLMNDLDEDTAGYDELVDADDGWEPIGEDDDGERFTGTFDGNGHTISDLYIDRENEDNVGLFGNIGENAEITNVGLIDAEVSGDENVGGLVGMSEGTISSSYANGYVGGSEKVGCLVGYQNAKGDATTIIENSYATGSVEGDQDIGGLVGRQEVIGGGPPGDEANALVKNSYASTHVEGNQDVGGLVGQQNVRGGGRGETEIVVENSYWNIETSGQDDSEGGTGLMTEEMTDYENDYPEMDDGEGNDFASSPWHDPPVDWNEDQEGKLGYPALEWQEEDVPLEIWTDDDELKATGNPGDKIEMDTSVNYTAVVEIDIITHVEGEGDFGEIGIENLAVKSEEMDEFVYFENYDDTITLLSESNPSGKEQLNLTWRVDIPFGVSAEEYDITVVYEIGENGTSSQSEENELKDNTLTRTFEISTTQSETMITDEGDIGLINGDRSSLVNPWWYLAIISFVIIIAKKKREKDEKL